MFEWFFGLVFWQQFLVLSAIWAIVNFVLMFIIEVGPLASSSPLSGGLSFFVLGIPEFIGLIIGAIAGGFWKSLYFICTPFVGFLLLLFVVVAFADIVQAFMSLLARRLGIYKKPSGGA